MTFFKSLIRLQLIGILLFPFWSEAQETYICPQPIPDGFIIVDYQLCNGCCGFPGDIYKPKIVSINTYESGDKLTVCAQKFENIEVAILNVRNCTVCCNSPSGSKYLDIIIVRDLEAGTRLTVCGSYIPPGWVRVDGTQFNCGTGINASKKIVIQKL